MKSVDGYFRRLNPKYYSMDIDYDYNMIKLIINGGNYCVDGTNHSIDEYITEQTEIYIVTNGVNNGLNFYKDLTNTPYDIECIPLTEMDEDGNIFTNIVSRPEDLEIIVDGLTLYPKIDYDIVDLAIDNVPTLIVFRNIIPKTCKIEVNVLNENCNFVRYFKDIVENNEGKRYISFNDDSLLLIPESFSVYVDNYKQNNKDMNIINTNTLEIKTITTCSNKKELNGKHYLYSEYQLGNNTNKIMNDLCKNIMVRFSYDDHTHLKEIFDEYKYRDENNLNSNYYHSYFKHSTPSAFDELCNNARSSSIRKMFIYNNLFKGQYNIFNCNDTNAINVFDVTIDGHPFENMYAKEDIAIDCNPILDEENNQ